jgi:hypothetical protein
LTQPTEVRFPANLLERVLELAGTDMILIGGQALAFWAAYYPTSAPTIAGRKVARRYGVHVADAIDPAPVAHIKAFVSKKLPQLLKLMSDTRRAELRIAMGIGA